MDKYNNPSGNTNSNDNNPWDYRPDQIADTQEIPVVDNTEPTEENAASNDPDHIPEYTPSSYYNASETEHKSHIGRNLFIGAVAVTAVAGSIALFNGNNQPTKATDATGITQTEQLTDTENSNTQFSPDSYGLKPDPEKIQNYNDNMLYLDGLTVQEFSNSCGVDNLMQAYQYAGEDLGSRLETCVEQMGYNVNNSGIRTTAAGTLCATSLGSFDINTDDNKFGSIQILAQIEDNNFNIQISVFPFDPDIDKVIEYNTDTIPTPEEAAQILADNL